MGVVGGTASAFVELTVQVLPWFAVGILTAALIKTFVPPRWAAGALSGRRGLPLAIGAGCFQGARARRCRSRSASED